MGASSTWRNVVLLLSALEIVLGDGGWRVPRGAALAAAEKQRVS